MARTISSEDQNLLVTIRESNKEAFNIFYEKYWQFVYQFSFNLSKNEKEAEDLTQNVFVEIWQNRRNIHIKNSVKAYLVSIVKHRLLDKIRRDKLFDRYASEIVKSLVHTEDSNPEKNFINRESIEILTDTLGLLPDRCRQVVYMNKFQQYSIREISLELQLSQQTIKNQLSTALKMLRKYSELVMLFVCFLGGML
jgi:RNA polymerase sigma-70 factor (ECF subfamily)